MRRGRSRHQEEKALTHLHLLRYKQDVGLFPFVSRTQTVFYEVVAAAVEVVKALNARTHAHASNPEREKNYGSDVERTTVVSTFIIAFNMGPKKKKKPTKTHHFIAIRLSRFLNPF